MSVITCIGSGNMGCALMKAVSRGGASCQNFEIFFTDSDSEKAGQAAAMLKAKVLNTNAEAAEKGDIIFLAVKPQVTRQVLAEIKPALKKRRQRSEPVLVSMAAGWPIAKIQEAAGTTGDSPVPVIRIMPNMPALTGRGMIALSSSKEVTAEKINEIKIILSGAGVVDCLEEKYMDAATGLSGSGPAYVCLFIEALADGGVRAGLPRDKALLYAAQTALGTAAMIQETGKHPGELKDMVTSPGGATIAGIAALEEGAFRGAVIKAVEASWKRAIELG